MATLTIYADVNDGHITSGDASYASAAAGGGTVLSAITNNSVFYVGQYVSDKYYCQELFVQYNTSALQNADITSIREELYLYEDRTVTNYTEEVRAYDWGSELTTADWVPRTSLASLTLLSSKIQSPIAGYNQFPSSDNFIAAINKTGYTRLMHNSDRHRLATVPSTNEYILWCAADYSGTVQDPKIVVDYTLIPTAGAVNFIGAGGIEAVGRTLSTLNFLTEPSVTVRAPVATHVTAKSPTNSYTAVISPTPTEATKIERIVPIDTGDAAVCQSIAEELISRWGRRQVSVSGQIPLEVRLSFMEMLHIKVPRAGINEPLVLQRKEHDVLAQTTNIVCGDIILDDNELIARMLQDLINK